MSRPPSAALADLDWAEVGRNINTAMHETAARLNQSLALLRSLRSTPAMLEAASKNKYRAAVARERKIGLDFVKAEAARVRTELGLPPE